MDPTDASIGHHFKEVLGRSPQSEIGTCLVQDAAITLHWAVGRRCAADAGDDSDGTWANKLGAEVGTQVPCHIDDEVHRFIEGSVIRSEEVKTTQGFYASDSQPNVIRPTPKPRTTLPTTGASPRSRTGKLLAHGHPGAPAPPRTVASPRKVVISSRYAKQRFDALTNALQKQPKLLNLSSSRGMYVANPQRKDCNPNQSISTDQNGCTALKT